MEENFVEGCRVRLKSGGPVMEVKRISEDGLIAYCSWKSCEGIAYNNVAFLTSVLVSETVTDK